MSAITTHVLDLAHGRPAVDLAVTLERIDKRGLAIVAGGARTDADGRVRTLLPEDSALEAGRYRLRFDTGDWFSRNGSEGFYPEVVVDFMVREGAHHHVPLLLSPFGYSTYRGS